MTRQIRNVIINGDRTVGDPLIGLGQQLLLKVKNLASFRKLKQFSLEQHGPHGTLLKASSLFGVDTIEITVPQVAVVEEERKIEVVAVEVTGAVLLVSFLSASTETTVNSYLVNETTGKISVTKASFKIVENWFAHPRLVGQSFISAYML